MGKSWQVRTDIFGAWSTSELPVTVLSAHMPPENMVYIYIKYGKHLLLDIKLK